jgi:polysaccharide deacetylase family protein (PEP-CTERM system associated)
LLFLAFASHGQHNVSLYWVDQVASPFYQKIKGLKGSPIQYIAMPKNIMTVDLEDYFCDLPLNTWQSYEQRITQTSNLILELLGKYKISATFFVVGHIAEMYPEVIEKIVNAGHEISSHGFAHLDLRSIPLSEFEDDLIRSLQILSKLSGEKILGFRAPFFSITKSNLKTLGILRKHVSYDSSIFPAWTPLYGISDAPRFPYRVSQRNPLEENDCSEFREIPLATYRIPIAGNIPVAGGFHLRFWPYQLIKRGIMQLNRMQQPAVIYIHPKDLDPAMPRLPQYSWHYYWGLRTAQNKFESLLRNFSFSSIREVVLKR